MIFHILFLNQILWFWHKKKIAGLDNQIIFNDFPVHILKLLEKINTQFLKINFNKQSDIMIGSYKFNLNSREMSQSNLRLKLTEKEINSIIYIFNSKDVVKIDELQSKVWGYLPELETHTVETHIYRLRKKISQKFHDENFILTNKSGYEIVKKKINLLKNFLQKNTNLELSNQKKEKEVSKEKRLKSSSDLLNYFWWHFGTLLETLLVW